MFSKKKTKASTEDCLNETVRQELQNCSSVLIGAGAGLSASAGMTYAGPRFEAYFSDFIAKYHFSDMYTAGFYPFATPEEYWAYWSRYIYYNRYAQPAGKPYRNLLALVRDKDYFVITTNVDHQFQLAGFDKRRLFYTQGDYGLWQCSVPCHQKTYDNEEAVRRMVAEQDNMRIPPELVPRCPLCGAPMAMNLRCDSRFVENSGWNDACQRYGKFVRSHEQERILLLELGVGSNTPSIIKYPFWQTAAQNPNAIYVCVNLGEAVCPEEIAARSICLNADIGTVLERLSQ